jgi:hypothetical protein
MEHVTSTITIIGPLEPIFDLITTTKHWPAWHPATIGVGGITERPFALNDQIREQARIGERVYEGTWTVIEHSRPRCATLRGSSGRIEIRYVFDPVDADQVRFSRTLSFYPEDFTAGSSSTQAVIALMEAQSDQALIQLRALIEQKLE